MVLVFEWDFMSYDLFRCSYNCPIAYYAIIACLDQGLKMFGKSSIAIYRDNPNQCNESEGSTTTMECPRYLLIYQAKCHQIWDFLSSIKYENDLQTYYNYSPLVAPKIVSCKWMALPLVLGNHKASTDNDKKWGSTRSGLDKLPGNFFAATWITSTYSKQIISNLLKVIIALHFTATY